MNFQSFSLPQFFIFIFLFITVLCSCKNDDAALPELCSYDSSVHIFGTTQMNQFNNAYDVEIYIDPNTGQFDTIPGTSVPSGGFSFPLGPNRLVSFEHNKRFHTDGNELTIQDLSTSKYSIIELRDTAIGQSVIFPQATFFGNDNNQIFILDTDDSIWEVNLLNNKVEKIIEDINNDNDAYVSTILYLKDSNDFLFGINRTAVNANTVTELYLYDTDIDTVSASLIIDESFGFVQVPQQDQAYFIKRSNGQEGFRLGEVKVLGGEIFTNLKSTSDLAIDQLSPYLQTIHTASNSYICRGGSTSIENPTSFLYKIDITSGELISEVELEDVGTMLGLASE